MASSKWQPQVFESSGLTFLCCCFSIQSCPILCDPMECSLPGSSLHGISQAQDAGVGYHFLLQEIFPTQGSNLCRLYWQTGFLHWATREAPTVLKYVVSVWSKAVDWGRRRRRSVRYTLEFKIYTWSSSVYKFEIYTWTEFSVMHTYSIPG